MRMLTREQVESFISTHTDTLKVDIEIKDDLGRTVRASTGSLGSSARSFLSCALRAGLNPFRYLGLFRTDEDDCFSMSKVFRRMRTIGCHRPYEG
jgi:hypothetical protein